MNPSAKSALGYSLPYFAVILTGVIATLVFLTLPILVGGITDQFGWGDKEVGWLAAADMGGSALASLLMAGVISRLDWKKSVRVAIAFAVAGNLASIYIESLSLLLTVRVLTGMSNGVILSVVFASLCRSGSPDRYFGVYAFTQLSLQALLLPLLPELIAWGGMVWVFVFLAIASAASGFLVRYFPDPAESVVDVSDSMAAREAGNVQGAARWGLLALAAQALYFLAPAAIWGYFEVIGENFNLSMGAVGDALGLAALAGIAGAVVVMVAGNYLGRMLSMGIGTAISVLAVWALMTGSGFFWFLIAAALMNFSWNYTFPYQMGTLALFDRNGSIAVLSLLVQTFGLSFGPLLASLLLVGSDFMPILIACMACYIVSLVLFYVSSLHGSGMKSSTQ